METCAQQQILIKSKKTIDIKKKKSIEKKIKMFSKPFLFDVNSDYIKHMPSNGSWKVYPCLYFIIITNQTVRTCASPTVGRKEEQPTMVFLLFHSVAAVAVRRDRQESIAFLHIFSLRSIL